MFWAALLLVLRGVFTLIGVEDFISPIVQDFLLASYRLLGLLVSALLVIVSLIALLILLTKALENYERYQSRRGSQQLSADRERLAEEIEPQRELRRD